ncbi:MAG: hypothetical protein WA156_13960 [Methylocystis silviterrae]
MKASGAPCCAGRFKECALRDILKIHKPRRKVGVAQLEPLWQRPVHEHRELCRSFGASESCLYIFWQSASLVDGNLHIPPIGALIPLNGNRNSDNGNRIPASDNPIPVNDKKFT